MSWNPTTKIMTAPLNLNNNGDIQQASGVNSGDLGKCFRDGIWNMWAKYKPVKSSKITPLTETELKALNYGLTIGVCGPNGSISAYLADYASQWSYTTPIGGNSERFRFFDLLKPGAITSTGYRGDANSFISMNDCNFPSSYLLNRGDSGVSFVLGLNYSTNLKEGSISLADLHIGGDTEDTPLSGMYFGLVFVYNGVYRLITDTYTVSAYPRSGVSFPQVTIAESGGSLSGITSDVTYTVFPILSASPHGAFATFQPTDRVIALPLSPFSFKARTAQATQRMVIMGLRSYLDRARPVVVLRAMFASSVSGETITDGSYEIRSASASGETGGTLWRSGFINGTGSMVSGTTYTVDTGRLNQSNQGWVYAKIYRGNSTSVYDEAWAEITDSDIPEIIE